MSEEQEEYKGTYKIVRMYNPSTGKRSRKIKGGLTKEEAMDHCRNPKTHKKGEWFDGFERED